MNNDTEPANQQEELDRAFLEDGFNLAAQYAGDGSKEHLLGAVSLLYENLDSFIGLFLESASAGGQPAACHKGCSWCCHQAVFAQEYEIRYLKNWMFANLPAEKLMEIQKRAVGKSKTTHVLAPEKRLLHKEACPLLENGACLAYEARPVACRIYLSMNVGSCENEFRNPGDISRFPALFELPLRAGRKLNEGFSFYLNQMDVGTKELPLEEWLKR